MSAEDERASAEDRPEAVSPFAALRHRDFRIYWSGQSISMIGMWMQQMAQAWVVVKLTGSSATIATISFVSSLPMIALAMKAGSLADRYDRRRILMVTQVLLAACAFVYAALIASDELTLGLVYVLAFCLGVVVAFDLPAAAAITPTLVPKEAIPSAISLMQSIFHGARLIGPALAGVVMAATSAAWAFVANGVSYFAVVASLAVIRPRDAASARARTASGGGMGEAFAYLREHHEIRGLIVFAGMTTALVFPFLVVFMAIVVKQHFVGDERALGVIMASSGLGALGGSLALPRVPSALRRRVIGAGCALSGVLLASLGLVHHIWAAAFLLTAMNVCVALSLGLAATIVQTTVPDRMRGRIMGLWGITFTGVMPASALLLGVVADQITLGTTLVIVGLLYPCLALPWLWREGIIGPRRAAATVST